LKARRKINGSALATALVVISLLLVLAFTAAGSGAANLWFTNRAQNARTAKNLAESAIALTISRLQTNPAYALTGSLPTVNVTLPSTPDGSLGQVCFDKNSGLPYSLNNLNSDSSVPGWNGVVVPGQSAYLIGVGRCNGLEHRVEAVIFFGRFNYAIGSSGPLLSHGGLSVAAINDTSEIPSSGMDTLSSSLRRPGAIESNSADSSAISLQSSVIQGDVQAAGDILLASNSSVSGEIRPHRSPVGLPSIPIASYDTNGKPDLLTLTQSNFASLSVKGYSRSSQSIEVSGPLNLDQGVLYVDGNLTVHGGINGTGAVVVNGTTTVDGSAGQLGQENRAVLLSKGDVNLSGSASKHQGFQGLIYTEGNFATSYVDLVGVFVANNSTGSTTTLDNTDVLQVASAGNVQFNVTTASSAVVGYDPPPNGAKIPDVYLNPAALIADPATGTPDLPANPLDAGWWNVTLLNGTQYSHQTYSQLDQLYASWFPGYPPTRLSAMVAQLNAGLLTAVNNRYASIYGTSGGGAKGTSSSSSLWGLNLSDFINKTDQIRVLSWRDL
jgi:cytoskeletal protein CcmA (bactofilin family)